MDRTDNATGRWTWKIWGCLRRVLKCLIVYSLSKAYINLLSTIKHPQLAMSRLLVIGGSAEGSRME
jgi:hypothetical protein